MGGDEERLGRLESAVAQHLGFTNVLDSVGQVYPRSLDLDVVSALAQVSAAPSSLATTIRLMAGHDLVTEGFRPGQVGSSAMPHKMNSRSCERVNGFAVLLRGYLTMVADLSGSQWNEGDVYCSVVRRVALPDAFFAIDGLFETFLTVLDDFGAFPAVIDRELERYLPFLSTTKVLMASVRKGVGRETAHEAIKEHAVAVALAMREDGQGENDLLARLAGDDRLDLSRGRAAATSSPSRCPSPARRPARCGRSPTGSPSSSTATPMPRPTDLETSCDERAPDYGLGPEYEHIYSGKVRDLYRTPDDRLLFVASDRISAYDWVLPTPIPDKGRILTALSKWWFKRLEGVVPNHVASGRIPKAVAGRAMVCERLEMLPIECVVRGYLAGSGLADYLATGLHLRQRPAPGAEGRLGAAEVPLHAGHQGRPRRARRERHLRRGDRGRSARRRRRSSSACRWPSTRSRSRRRASAG